MSELKHYQMYVDGKWVASRSGKPFDSINPSPGNAWQRFPQLRRRMWIWLSGRPTVLTLRDPGLG